MSVPKTVWSIVFLCVSLCGVWYNTRCFSELVSPLAYGVHYVEVFFGKGLQWFSDRQALFSEIERLHLKVKVLEKEQRYHSFLMRENEHLKEMLKVEASLSWDTRCVEVLAIPFERGASIMWIAANDNVKRSQIVVTEQGLVGRVDAVNHNVARVRLVTDSLSRLPVYVEGAAANEMVIAGQNNHELVVIHQKKASDSGECVALQVGMRLVTAAYGNIPPNIPVAIIERIENQKIYARPIASLQNLHYAHIIFDAPLPQ